MGAYEILLSHNVTRLCHFTKLQSLTHIIASEEGVLASSSIRQDTKHVSDTARYDGELNFVCCSVEYPNSWFLKRVEGSNNDPVFTDWAVLYIDLSILKDKRIKFCPCNASTAKGKYINNNVDEIESIFSHCSVPKGYVRPPKMLSACPTDGQTEILIADNIPRKYFKGIALGNEDAAKCVYAMLKLYGLDHIPLYIAPDVLSPTWSQLIRAGCQPEESLCVWPEED